MSGSERLMLIAPPVMEHTPAFNRAACLAKASGAALHIVAFDYEEGLVTAELINEDALSELKTAYVERHRQWLEQQAVGLRRLGITVTTEVVWVDHPVHEILDHVHDLDPRMVIKDLKHESFLARVLFTSMDLRLLRECPAPLHLITRMQQARPRKIVAAVDPFRTDERFKDLNRQVIEAAEKLAAQCEAELHLLHAYDLSYIYSTEGGMGYAAKLGEELYQAEEQAFSELADSFGVPGQRRHFISGTPAKVINDFAAREQVDVIVMGRVNRHGLNKLLGSTTEQVVYHMPGSVLVIKSEQS
ncbi:MAG TPA: universal stress protein [Pseudomonas sp.]|jgi:universal stress protein E